MTTIDKRAAIAALGGPEKARYMIERVCNGDRFRDAGRASSAVRDLALSALEADDGRALLRDYVRQVVQARDMAILGNDSSIRWLKYLAADGQRLLAAEPAQIAEPTAPAGDDEARIAECMHRVGQAMLSMRHDWMLCVYDRDNPEDQKRKEAVESIGEAFALMREILSRAVKAEGDLRDVTRRNASWCEHQHSVLRDLRAKLAAAEKERDAAIAAQNALRSSPPAAPAGEAPAQGAGDDDTLRRFLRFGEDIPRGGERLLSVVADLCRRELARGER